MPKSDQGIEQDRYRVVPRTLIFLFDSANRVLLLKGAETKKLWAGLYNGIGGHIERGEDIYEAASRELLEETGITGINLCLCAQIIVDVSDQVGVAIFVFKGEYLGNDFSNSSEGALCWVSIDEIDAFPLVEDLPELIPRVASHQSTAPIIVGKYSYDDKGKMEISFR
jgi:8-oxo-dGTP diphosphatase